MNNRHYSEVWAGEEWIEEKWVETEGIDEDGHAWMTPRMIRIAYALQKKWEQQEKES